MLGKQADLAALQDQQAAGFSLRLSGIGSAASILEPDVPGLRDHTVMETLRQVLALEADTVRAAAVTGFPNQPSHKDAHLTK